MATVAILDALNEMDEAPWANIRGKPMDARMLANYLRRYGVTSKSVRIGDKTPKGYTREDLHDPWSRYLVAPTHESATPATCATNTLESKTI